MTEWDVEEPTTGTPADRISDEPLEKLDELGKKIVKIDCRGTMFVMSQPVDLRIRRLISRPLVHYLDDQWYTDVRASDHKPAFEPSEVMTILATAAKTQAAIETHAVVEYALPSLRQYGRVQSSSSIVPKLFLTLPATVTTTIDPEECSLRITWSELLPTRIRIEMISTPEDVIHSSFIIPQLVHGLLWRFHVR